MSISLLRIWESRLKAHLNEVAKTRPVSSITLIEVVDEAALWTDPFAELPPVLAQLDFESLMSGYPLLGCAAASEIGYRFEGVGTVFWAKFEDLLGTAIPPNQRYRLAEAFAELAGRYSIQKPVESGFSRHFSIIAWPIANALMPIEIAAPLGRLLARGPGSSVMSGRTFKLDLSAMRAWALSWEGVRLGDWLYADALATRVITALLTDNAQSTLSEATFRRVAAGYTQQSEAFFALCAAKRRQRTVASVPTAVDQTDFGRLSLERVGGDFVLSVAWAPLAPALLEQGRQESSARNWRPRLWDVSRTHYENALGSLPIMVRLEALPKENTSAFEAAPQFFGENSPVVAALLARVVDWVSPLVFLCDPEDGPSERADLPLSATRGQAWILDRGGTVNSLPIVGEFAGVNVRAADLTDETVRAALIAEGWLQGTAKALPRTARHPLDAITQRRGRVRPDMPFCIFDGDTLQVERLSRRGLSAHGLTAEQPTPAGAATPCLFLFERETAFDALSEQRLLAKIESTIAGARWPTEVMLLAEDEILVYARDHVIQDGAGLPASNPILQALQAEHVRRRLLELGRAVLRVRVGHHPWDSVIIQRVDGEVDWNEADPGASLGRVNTLVAAEALLPYRFSATSQNEVHGSVQILARQFENGRLAVPALLQAQNRYNLSALSANFSEVEGCRQMVARGGGVLDLARARSSWASAECRSLAAVAARVRVVHQFEAPLVVALCGREWRMLEERSPEPLSSGERLFREVLAAGLIELPESFSPDDRSAFEDSFAGKIATACPYWADEGQLSDEAADFALSEAFEAVLTKAHGQGHLLEFDAEDFDFGAPAEAWQAAAAAAMDAVVRSPLLDLIAPTKGAHALARRSLGGADLAETSSFLADWTSEWCLPRSVINRDLACKTLQFWLAPRTTDSEAALRHMARDVFLARAVRFITRRMADPAGA